MPINISDATLIVNDEVIGTIANSVKYNDGFGEATQIGMSTGGGKVEPVYSRDLSTAIGKVVAEIPTTVANAELIRTWKANENRNVVQIVTETAEGSLTRTFTQAALTSDPEVSIGSEASITIEFMANQAI